MLGLPEGSEEALHVDVRLAERLLEPDVVDAPEPGRLAAVPDADDDGMMPVSPEMLRLLGG